MEKLLKARVLVITALFGLFGFALPKLLEMDELQSYYNALTPLLALVVSFLISFMLKAKWSIKLRNTLKMISVLVFVLLLGIVFLHTHLYIKDTFRYSDFEGNVGTYYVKGNVYTARAKQFLSEHPEFESDSELVKEGFGGPEGKNLVWTQESINNNILWLITSYSLLVIILVALLSMILEILVLNYSKSNKKLMEE